LPKPLMDWIEKYLKENEDVFAIWGVDTAPKVARVLIEHGKAPLEQTIAVIREQEARRKAREKEDKDREKALQKHG